MGAGECAHRDRAQPQPGVGKIEATGEVFRFENRVEVAVRFARRGQPDLDNVALDQPGPPIPWEERRLADPELFGKAGQRMATAISPFVERPLAARIWPSATQSPSVGDNLGSQLARMRHRLELEWGLRTLEVPLSRPP